MGRRHLDNRNGLHVGTWVAVMKKEQFRCVYCSKLIPSKERASKVCGICWGLLIQIAKTQDMFRRGQ